MFNIFKANDNNGVLVVSESKFWSRFKNECTPDEFFDKQGNEHASIDLRLVEKIEDYLAPHLGRWEQSDVWFHNIDFYGDGIRSLIISWPLFQTEFIKNLQLLLNDEHEEFCILCQLYSDSPWTDESKIGCLAIYNNKILMSKGVANKLALVA